MIRAAIVSKSSSAQSDLGYLRNLTFRWDLKATPPPLSQSQRLFYQTSLYHECAFH